MPSKTFVFGVTVIAVLIIVGGVSWTLYKPNLATSPTPDNSQTTTNPANSTNNQNTEEPINSNTTNPDNSGNPDSSNITVISPEDVRDTAMTYINKTYPKTAQYMNNLTWLGGRSEVETSGNETYMYYASDWTVTLQWEPVSNPIVRVFVGYNSETVTIAWEGTYQNNAIKQTSYQGNP